MPRRSLLLSLILCTGALCAPATVTGSEIEFGSGKGWVSFGRLPESPDYAFIRAYLESSDDYRESQRSDMSPWDMNKLLVGYHDVNDDGVQEMFLWFDVSSYYCGTVGCRMEIFQRRDGKWEIIGGDNETGLWVSDEKIMGYRTIYGLSGALMRWVGHGYRTTCNEILPAEMHASGRRIRCENG